MKVATVLCLLVASATAFTSPQFATRAVGKPTKAKKVAPVAKKAAPVAKKAAPVAKKAAPVAKKAAATIAKKVAPVAKKAVTAVKKAAPKKVVIKAKKASPFSKPIVKESQGYPSFASAAQSFRLGKFNGGGSGKVIEPVFLHPTLNTNPVPSFDYKEAAKARVKPGQQQVYAYDDGLTELERKQRATIPAFLTGGAKSRADKSLVRSDIEEQEYPFGLDADRFQLLFITIFGLFTLVGCLSGSIQLD